MKLDKNLKKMMIDKKINLKFLAREVGLPVSTIHGWLNGTRPKSVIDLKKLATFFKVTIDELCFGGLDDTFESNAEIIISEFGDVQLVLRQKGK